MAWLGGQNSRIFFALRVESSTRKFCGQGVKRAIFWALRRFHTVIFLDKCEKSMEGASGVLV